MYLLENPAYKHTNLPSKLYWAKNDTFYLKNEVNAHGLVLLVLVAMGSKD